MFSVSSATFKTRVELSKMKRLPDALMIFGRAIATKRTEQCAVFKTRRELLSKTRQLPIVELAAKEAEA
ncbi:MAG TPA: hypothetical protein VF571_04110 [Pyrinomonadaceae bacterium]